MMVDTSITPRTGEAHHTSYFWLYLLILIDKAEGFNWFALLCCSCKMGRTDQHKATRSTKTRDLLRWGSTLWADEMGEDKLVGRGFHACVSYHFLLREAHMDQLSLRMSWLRLGLRDQCSLKKLPEMCGIHGYREVSPCSCYDLCQNIELRG